MAFHLNGYSNFHDDNQDWIVSKIKSIEDTEAHTEELAEAAQNSADAAQESANDALNSKNEAHQSELNAAQSETNAANSAQDAADSAVEAANTVENTLDQIELLQTRVDNIIPDGTQTAGNTELLDIRVGYNSEVYDSAGNAVRGQVSDLHDEIASIADVIKSKNIHNMDTDSVGVISNDGTINTESVTWRYSEPIEISVGNAVSLKAATSYGGTDGCTMLAYYDANDNFINRDSCWSVAGTWSHTMTGQQAKIRIMYRYGTPPFMVNIGSTLLPYERYSELPFIEFTENAAENILQIVGNEGLSTIELTVAADGTGDYTSLRDAVDYIENSPYEASIIHIKPGLYDIAQYYTQQEMAVQGFVGLKLPVNCQLIGTGDRDATIITLTLPTANQNISTLNIQSNCTIKNVYVYGEKTRYAIHDDFGYAFENDMRLLENCKIEGKDLALVNAYGSGNTRNGAEWTFKDCIFTGNGTPFSNHNGTGTVTKNNKLKFINCRFINTNSIDNQGYALTLRSLATPMGEHMSLVDIYGCTGNGKILLSEENASVYGAGIRFRVTGYADNFGDVQIINTDQHDYSGNVDIT